MPSKYLKIIMEQIPQESHDRANELLDKPDLQKVVDGLSVKQLVLLESLVKKELYSNLERAQRYNCESPKEHGKFYTCREMKNRFGFKLSETLSFIETL